MPAAARSSARRPVCDTRTGDGGAPPRTLAAWWLVATAAVTFVGVVTGGPPAVRAAEPPPARGPEAGDAMDRLDSLVEKLDRLVDRLAAERMAPPVPPPHQHADRPHQRDRSPGAAGGPDWGPMPGLSPDPWGDRRKGGSNPWGWMPFGPPAGVPPEMREMMERRMRETRDRMHESEERMPDVQSPRRQFHDRVRDMPEDTRKKIRDLEERLRKLEAEMQRLRDG